MKSVWIIDDDVFNKIKKIVDENINSEIAKERMNKNINKIGIDISKNNVWKVLIGCEITTISLSFSDFKSYKLMQDNQYK